MDSFTYHHLPPEDQQAIQSSYERKDAPKPANPTIDTSPSTAAAPAPTPVATPTPKPKPKPAAMPAPRPAGPQIYGMDSFTYHHLPPEDQQAIRTSYLADHGLPTVGTQPAPFTPQSGTTGMAIGPNQRSIEVMPFPGSLSVTCSQSTDDLSGGPCGIPKPGQTRVEAEKAKGPTFSVSSGETVTSNRSDSTLGEDGTRRSSLDVTTELKVTASGGVEANKTGVEGGAYQGKSSTYQVTVDSARADALESGDEPMPNPYDPLTLRNGEGIQLSKKDFSGGEGSISYRALELGMDHETSHEVSAGVQRVDDKTTRILVGDKESVKNSLKLGVGTDDVGLAISSSTEFGDGNVKSVDLDLSTAAGWQAYQRFVNGGEVPAVTAPKQPGVVDAADSESATWAGGLSLDAHAGPVSLSVGGTSVEGDVTQSKHPDGTVDNSITARQGDVTMRSSQTTKPDGSDGDRSYSFSLKGVDKWELNYLTQVQTGNDVKYSKDQDASISFSEDDLKRIQQNALDFMSWGTGQARQDMTPSEIKSRLQDDPYAPIPMLGGANPKLTMLGSAKSPQEIQLALYTASHGNPNVLADLLVRNHLDAGMAHKKSGFDTRAPGSMTTY